jgi:hypothetical protein
VTPAGDRSTAPGAAVCELKVGVDVEALDDGLCADVEDRPASEPDEQPERVMEPSMVAASTERIGWRRMSPIYATLGTVLERTTFQECCRV